MFGLFKKTPEFYITDIISDFEKLNKKYKFDLELILKKFDTFDPSLILIVENEEFEKILDKYNLISTPFYLQNENEIIDEGKLPIIKENHKRPPQYRVNNDVVIFYTKVSDRVRYWTLSTEFNEQYSSYRLRDICEIYHDYIIRGDSLQWIEIPYHLKWTLIGHTPDSINIRYQPNKKIYKNKKYIDFQSCPFIINWLSNNHVLIYLNFSN